MLSDTVFTVCLKMFCEGIKNLMQKLMGQLMNCDIDVDSLEDEDCVQVSQNRVRCSMSSLISWYESVTKVCCWHFSIPSLIKHLTFRCV